MDRVGRRDKIGEGVARRDVEAIVGAYDLATLDAAFLAETYFGRPKVIPAGFGGCDRRQAHGLHRGAGSLYRSHIRQLAGQPVL